MRLAKLDLLPDSDALLVAPLRPSALKAVVEVRRLVMLVVEYSRELQELPDSEPTLLTHANTSSFNLGKGNLPGALQVVNITAGMSSLLLSGLRKLVVNSTWGEEPDPIARDGKPNRLMQKLLRELNAVDICCTLLQVPFKKGVDIDQVSTHPELATLKAILNLVYRLLKQMCKEDYVNSKSVFQYVGAMRSQLGKGILVTPTIKEIFANKRDLLQKIDADIVDNFIRLLQKDKEPQYIDFLMSVCTIGSSSSTLEPVAKVQNLVTDALLENNSHLLPKVVIKKKDSGAGISMHLAANGIKDKTTGEELCIDVADFKVQKEVRGKLQDYCGWILNAPLPELDNSEKLMRYFIRCSNLYARLALGRNQLALRLLITNPLLSLSYEQIQAVLQEQSLPYLLRARYFNLMCRLFVDRDPQNQVPAIINTRLWSKCQAEPSDLQVPSADEQTAIPTAPDGFQFLQEYLIIEVPKMADCKDEHGNPSLNGDPTFGQLEMLRAMLALMELLLIFGFFRTKIPSVETTILKRSGTFSTSFKAGVLNKKEAWKAPGEVLKSFKASADLVCALPQATASTAASAGSKVENRTCSILVNDTDFDVIKDLCQRCACVRAGVRACV